MIKMTSDRIVIELAIKREEKSCLVDSNISYISIKKYGENSNIKFDYRFGFLIKNWVRKVV